METDDACFSLGSISRAIPPLMKSFPLYRSSDLSRAFIADPTLGAQGEHLKRESVRYFAAVKQRGDP